MPEADALSDPSSDRHSGPASDPLSETLAISLGDRLVDGDWIPPEIDTTKAHPARMYDYFLGGYSL